MLDTFGRLASGNFLNNPIFIVGGSRSGTIALLKAMGVHPRILATPSEDPFISDIGRLAYDLGCASDRDVHYYERTLRISRDYIFDALRKLALESALGAHYGIKYIVAQSLKGGGFLPAKQFWCTKSFPGKNTAQGLQVLYPTAKFIWILRSGVHVVHSRTKFPEFKDLDFTEHCKHWADSIHRFSYLSNMPSAAVVHQEDFAEDPDKIFRRLFSLIGVPYDPSPTAYALNTHVHPLHELSIKEGVNVRETLKQRRPPYESWDEKQKCTFSSVCGEAMGLAGYEMPF